MAGMGVGAGSLKILTGVLHVVHRVARPLRGSVSCGSGWSVPCVSIQLTLSQEIAPGQIDHVNWNLTNRFRRSRPTSSCDTMVQYCNILEGRTTPRVERERLQDSREPRARRAVAIAS